MKKPYSTDDYIDYIHFKNPDFPVIADFFSCFIQSTTGKNTFKKAIVNMAGVYSGTSYKL